MAPSFGIKLGGLVPDYATTIAELPDLAVEFERMGADDVIHGEHIMFAPTMPHPGETAATHSRVNRRSDVSDVVVLFSMIAAKTTTLKVFSGVLLGAAHPFALLAKQAATLDVLSRGRFVMGVGSGWFAPEFEAMGIPHAERYARMEETIRACRELWTSELASFHGTWINFDDMLTEPAPLTKGGVPIWWGGKGTRATARRVVTLGDGWIASQAATHDEIAGAVELITKTCEDHQRDPGTVGYRVTLPKPPPELRGRPDEVIAHAVDAQRRLSALGVTHYTVPVDLYGINLDAVATLLRELRH